MAHQLILKLFKAMVIEPEQNGLDTTNALKGFVTDFRPTPLQLKILKEEFKPLDLITLFTVHERENAGLAYLLHKQILHYIEVYGLNQPGLFNLEQSNGKVATLSFVRGVTQAQLGDMVRDLLYANAPIKDAPALKEIIESVPVDYDLNQVKNNEMRVILYKLGKNIFYSGDDAVRYMCYVATESTLLIKSKQVIKAIKTKAKVFPSSFFRDHEKPLAQVFHRHKNLILAAKCSENKGAINRISRLAKDAHVPIHEPASKRFLSVSYREGVNPKVLSLMTLRDKFKILNLINYKIQGRSIDAFVIRNGKVHLEKGRAVLNQNKLHGIIGDILASLKNDLSHLNGKRILLDTNVDYGLPVSRKQTIGQLPFGTTVTPGGNAISAGIYWENAWGARDLDLSAIDHTGNRTGWGAYSGYNKSNPVTFSGDLTDARNGAMEFMTSKVDYDKPYALFINIFAGDEGTKFALVVGTKTKDQWIGNLVLREVGELNSKGNIIGFVKSGKFVVYACRLNSAYWSAGSKEQAIVARGLADFWTVRSLLDVLQISYSVERDPEVVYDHDLTYSGFSLDKLEALLQA